MTDYYVNGLTGSNGGSGRSRAEAWKTLQHANNSIAPGDKVAVAPATYYEQLTIDKANTTWVRDGDEGVVYIDGKYDPEEAFSQHPTRILPPGTAGKDWLMRGSETFGASLVSIKASGVVLDGGTKYGIKIGNCIGKGLTIHPDIDDVVVTKTWVDFCLGGGFRLHGNNCTLIDYCCTRVSMTYWDPTRGDAASGAPEGVPSAVLVLDGHGSKVMNGLVEAVFGEGIVAGKRSSGVLIKGNEVSCAYHAGIYINYSRDAVIDGNLIWGASDFATKIGVGIAFGDETGGDSASYVKQHGARNAKIINNVVIVPHQLWQLRVGKDNYQTVVGDEVGDGLYLGFNTFIANEQGEKDRPAILMPQGLAPNRCLVENNIFYISPALDITPVSWANSGANAGIRNNLWNTRPPTKARGEGDFYGDTGLIDPEFKPPSINFVLNAPVFNPVSIKHLDFYKLRETSPAIGMESDNSSFKTNTPPWVMEDINGVQRSVHSAVGASEFVPVVVDPPDEPDEPPVDPPVEPPVVELGKIVVDLDEEVGPNGVFLYVLKREGCLIVKGEDADGFTYTLGALIKDEVQAP